ncbi:MAG: FG-GAP repeat protein [Terriglobales bacterium]
MRRPFATAILILCATLALCDAALAASAHWTQLAELTPTNRSKNDWFGISIAMSGNTVVVGDFDPNIEDFGTVDVFAKPEGGWSNMTQTATLTSSDNGIGFGTSVAISGDVIVVGAADTSNFRKQSSPGAAYVFVKPAGGWTNMTESLKLTASDGLSGDAFGNSVAINSNTIAVGAFFVNNFSGRAYVFTCSKGACIQAAELSASDSNGILDYLGCSVAISGNTVVAGSYGHNNFQGATYVFEKPAGGWTDMTETAELTTSNGQASDDFGFTVAINNGTVVAGAPGAFSYYGAAYIFVEPPTGWATTSNFTAGLGAPGDVQYYSFAQAVAISENAAGIVVGAPAANVGSNLEQGAVYAYAQPKSGWTTTRHPYAEATASDGASADLMGSSVAISGNVAVAGAPKSSSPGAAYVFGR